MALQYLLTQRQGMRAGEGVRSCLIPSWQEWLLLSGSGSKTTARRRQLDNGEGARVHIFTLTNAGS